MTLFDRKGSFYIDKRLLEDSPEVVQQLFSTVIPIRGELLYMYNAFKYDAISNDFDPVPFGELAPFYKAVIEDNQFKEWVRE